MAPFHHACKAYKYHALLAAYTQHRQQVTLPEFHTSNTNGKRTNAAEQYDSSIGSLQFELSLTQTLSQ